MRVNKFLQALIFIAGTGVALHGRADVFVRDDIITDPDPSRFTICHDYGCASLDVVKLSDAQWQRVRELFASPAASPADERERIRRAIALLEAIVGPITGTARDKGGTWPGLWQAGQMDCIDESINTTIYLTMLQKYGLLRWHSVADRSTRWSLFRWPHTTAVIEERASGREWAVDSWFLDNGEPPFVLPLEIWKSGWMPPREQSGAAGNN